MYEITDKERRELEQWYMHRRNTLRHGEPEDGRRFQCFLAQVARVRTGLQERGYLDADWLQKYRRAGRRAAAVRKERRRGA